MPARFPGVDPFIECEGFWPDFHASFVTYWRDALAELLPDHYDARLNERVLLIEYQPARGRLIGPDIAILAREPGGGRRPSTDLVVSGVEPVTLTLPVESEEVRETYIEVYHRPDSTLVAVLELLSPTNKTGADRTRYLDKRAAILRQSVHLIELDLLLSGDRLPLADRLPAGHCFAYVSRFTHRPYCDVYAWSLRQPLPAIPIPLWPPDPESVCDLQAVYSSTYQRGRYDRVLRREPGGDLPLDKATRQWIDSVLTGRSA